MARKKPKRYVAKPTHKRNLSEGVFQEMSRYDGGYTDVKYGKLQTLEHNGEVLLAYYDQIEFTATHCTPERWRSFACVVHEVATNA